MTRRGRRGLRDIVPNLGVPLPTGLMFFWAKHQRFMGSPCLAEGPDNAGGHAVRGGLGTTGLLYNDKAIPEGT